MAAVLIVKGRHRELLWHGENAAYAKNRVGAALRRHNSRMGIDIGWARAELAKFAALTVPVYHAPPRGVIGSGSFSYGHKVDDIVASAHIVEKILDRVVPDWRTTVPRDTKLRWSQHREAALRADVALAREVEIRQMLGDDAPSMSAAAMHPWVWDGAKTLWQSGHRREAVTSAARQLNAETQNKMRRRDISEADLFKQAFSLEDPKPGNPRLRLMANDGGATFRNLHRGLMAFADGAFSAIRNPNSHEANLPELTEHEALEMLAAFSYLARQVDVATLVVS